MTIDEARYNDAVLKAAILESVMDALDGKPVSDFMESFLEVSTAKDARSRLGTVDWEEWFDTDEILASQESWKRIAQRYKEALEKIAGRGTFGQDVQMIALNALDLTK